MPITTEIFFKLPNDKQIHYWACEGSVLEPIRYPCFVVRPFSRQSCAKYFYPIINKVVERVNDIAVKIRYNKNHIAPNCVGTEEYKDNILSALEQINLETFKKIVISRVQEISIPEGFNIVRHYEQLLNEYPDAFIYLISDDEFGTWMGASPELLLERKGDEVSTHALAGTAHVQNQEFTQKEQEEQSIVVRYIKEVFSRYANEIKIEPQIEVKYGNITHLRNIIRGHIPSNIETTIILEALHPTSAVGGYPKKESVEWISKLESHDRQLYSGYLGLLNDEKNASVFVNLRNGYFYNENLVYLYAGGGIVLGSDPIKEWEETQEKMKSLLI